MYLEKCCDLASIGGVKPEDDGDLSLQKPAQIGASSTAGTLTIVFAGKCETQIYILSENILQDKTSGKTVALTSAQIEMIRRYVA